MKVHNGDSGMVCDHLFVKFVNFLFTFYVCFIKKNGFFMLWYPVLLFPVKDPEKGWFPRNCVVRVDEDGGHKSTEEKPKSE